MLHSLNYNQEPHIKCVDVPNEDNYVYSFTVKLEEGKEFEIKIADFIHFDYVFDNQCIKHGLDYYEIVVYKINLMRQFIEDTTDLEWKYYFENKIYNYVKIYRQLKIYYKEREEII